MVLARLLAGAFSANLGALNSMLGELTTLDNQAAGFTTLPIAAGLVRRARRPVLIEKGASVGPALASALAHPVERFPNAFGGIELLRRHPYLLSLSSAACFSALALMLCAFGLRETLPAPSRARSGETEPLLQTASAAKSKPWRELLSPEVRIVPPSR